MITIDKKQGIASTDKGAVRISPKQVVVLEKIASERDLGGVRRGRHRSYVPMHVHRLRAKLRKLGLRIEESNGTYRLVR